eukprot:5066454-Amphidinium_carterae.1
MLKGLMVLVSQGHEVIVLGDTSAQGGTRSGFTSTSGQDSHLQQVRIYIYNRSGYASTSAGPGQDLHLHEQ